MPNIRLNPADGESPPGSPSVKPRKDLKTQRLRSLPWGPSDANDSLDEIYTHVTRAADDAIDWYLRAKKWKKRLARGLRFTTIVLVSLAGLLPLLAQIQATQRARREVAVEAMVQTIVQATAQGARQGTGPAADTAAISRAARATEAAARRGAAAVMREQNNNTDWWTHPAWASVILAVAAALVLLDRFFGYSTGWIRFIDAELKIRQAVDDFELEWQKQRVPIGDNPPSAEQATSLISACRTFTAQLNTIIQAETSNWIEEFRTTLRQVDESVQAKAAETRAAPVTVVVTNGDELQDGWMLSVDARPGEIHWGKSAAIPDLWPGTHTFRASGRKPDGTFVQDARAVLIKPGEEQKVELTLQGHASEDATHSPPG